MDVEKLLLRPVEQVSNEVLQTFDCGNESLNTFLYEDSKLYAKHGITLTTSVFEQSDPEQVIAYFSLSADAICLNSMERMDLGLPFEAPIPFFPAVKITKLAVQKEWQSQGLGRTLINLIEGLVYSKATAVRLLNVNAINDPRTIQFYERCRFLPNLDAEERKRHQKRKKKQGQDEQVETILMHRDIYADPDENE